MPQPTEEELQSMSPEQLAELQKKNCIFCKIIKEEVPSKKVYDDDDCYCILDINPAAPGHVLILPRVHYQIMPQIPEKLIGSMFKVSKAISQAQLKAFQAQGTSIFVANGVIAGQKAPHFMIHVFPRTEKDNIGMVLPQYKLTPEQLNDLKNVLQPGINRIFGVKTQPKPEPEQPPLPLPQSKEEPAMGVENIPEELFEPQPRKKETRKELPEEDFTEELTEQDIDLDKMRELYR